MAYNKKAGHAVRSAGVPHSRRNKSQRDSSPLHWGWSDALDWGQTGLTAAGMIPGLGNFADLANVAVSGGRAAYAKATGDEAGVKKHLAAGALNAAAAIPGAGLAVGGTKLAKAGLAAAKGAKTLDKVADSTKLVKKGIDAKTKAKGALTTAKNLATKGKDKVASSMTDMVKKGLKEPGELLAKGKKAYKKGGMKGVGKDAVGGTLEYYGKDGVGKGIAKAVGKAELKTEKELVKDKVKKDIKYAHNKKKAKEKSIATKDKSKKENIA